MLILCEIIPVLLFKNIIYVRPRCNAIPSETFPHISYCILPTPSPHFTYTSSQFISSKLFSFHFISSHKSTKFFLTIFILFEHSSFFLISPKLVSTHLGSSARQRTTSYYKACPEYFPILFCTKYFPVLLCTTKLARSTSQYYFILQNLHKAIPNTSL